MFFITTCSGGASATAEPSDISAVEEYAPPIVDMNAPPPYSECDEHQAVMTDVVLTMPAHYTLQQQAAILPALSGSYRFLVGDLIVVKCSHSCLNI